MTKTALRALPRPPRAENGERNPVDTPSTAANDNEAPAVAQAAENDNNPVPRAAANDNDPAAGIRVFDDLPRPLPVLRGESEMVRKLLDARFRQILFGDKP